MTKDKLNDSRVLGVLFVLGQIATILGILIGVGGMFWNLIVTILGAILCSSGIALSRFSRVRVAILDVANHPNAHGGVINTIFNYSRVVERISIVIAGLCMLVIIVGVPKWVDARYLIIALIVSVLVFTASIFISSLFVAWRDFFRQRIKEEAGAEDQASEKANEKGTERKRDVAN